MLGVQQSEDTREETQNLPAWTFGRLFSSTTQQFSGFTMLIFLGVVVVLGGIARGMSPVGGGASPARGSHEGGQFPPIEGVCGYESSRISVTDCVLFFWPSNLYR